MVVTTFNCGSKIKELVIDLRMYKVIPCRHCLEKNLGGLHVHSCEAEVIDVRNKLTMMFYGSAVARAHFLLDGV